MSALITYLSCPLPESQIFRKLRRISGIQRAIAENCEFSEIAGFPQMKQSNDPCLQFPEIIDQASQQQISGNCKHRQNEIG